MLTTLEEQNPVNVQLAPRRGRPKKQPNDSLDTRESLIRAGMVVLTESGFTRSGIETILRSVGVPKGSFYHYFASKEAFGIAVLMRYRQYFEAKLDRFLLDEAYPPLERLQRFAQETQESIVRHNFKRGCLIGNLEQESTLLPTAFREHLQDTYQSWQNRVADCLVEAQRQGDIPTQENVTELAQAFWMGWEGAVHRARLVQDIQPLRVFIEFFIHAMTSK